MKQETTVDPINPENKDITTLTHQRVMTPQFTEAYRRALSFSGLELDKQLRYRNVRIHEKDHMHELYTANRSDLPHLVLLHGYGGTSLTFIRTFQHLKDRFQVHALDTFGVGLSSRGEWKDKMTIQETGRYYTDAIEEWRKEVGIEKFVLAGHSFGGYISALYYERYRERVEQLIFLSPAGSGDIPEQMIRERQERAKFFFCIAQKVFGCGFRPSKVMNAVFIGNKFIDRILTNRLKLPEDQKSAWKKYLKHVIDQDECSEGGFYTFFEWPLQPKRSIETILREQQKQKKLDIRIDFLFGDEDWMVQEGAKNLVRDFKNMHLHQIDNAGHQLIFDNPRSVSQSLKRVATVL